MANDAFGLPLLSNPGYKRFVNPDGSLVQQQDTVYLQPGLTAANGEGGTQLTVAGSAADAKALAVTLGTTIPVLGTPIPDADTAISVAGGSHYTMASASASRIITIGNTGSPLTGEAVIIDINRTSAFAIVIKDNAGTTLLTVPASVKMTVSAAFDGANFASARACRIQ